MQTQTAKKGEKQAEKKTFVMTASRHGE